VWVYLLSSFIPNFTLLLAVVHYLQLDTDFVHPSCYFIFHKKIYLNKSCIFFGCFRVVLTSIMLILLMIGRWGEVAWYSYQILCNLHQELFEWGNHNPTFSSDGALPLTGTHPRHDTGTRCKHWQLVWQDVARSGQLALPRSCGQSQT